MTSRSLTLSAALVLMLDAGAPAMASDGDIGSYLAGRQARFDHDFEAAAQYFTRALTQDPSNPQILESAVVAHLSLGQLDKALPIARKIEAEELRSQVAQIVLMVDEIAREDHDAVLTRIEEARGIGMLADGLIAGWVLRGKGDMEAALAQFDTVSEERGLRSFAMYHKALALASVGDFETADGILSGQTSGPMQQTRPSTIAHAEVLSQLGRNDDAVTMLNEVFSGSLDLELIGIAERLEAGETLPFTRVRGAKDGAAEVFFTIGQALSQDSTDDYMLVYARSAMHLNPDHVEATLMTAELLEALERYELANDVYKRVPMDHPSFHIAEMGRAESLRRAGRTEAAVEVLESLAKSYPDLPTIHVAAGDMHRFLEEYADAVAAYDRAIALYEEMGTPHWFAYYTRAISNERQGNWELAEPDFRRALELNPEQPQVLNYLGYSLVEEQIKLDEALDMIERAVAAQPDSGYIVDSLGWVLYRLGRYEEAVIHMERAVELEPVDPVINDHLGDVLWAVGRYTEARFQWKRALSFIDDDTPTPDIDPARIRRKLEVGLDVVLDEEGAEPLRVADEDG